MSLDVNPAPIYYTLITCLIAGPLCVIITAFYKRKGNFDIFNHTARNYHYGLHFVQYGIVRKPNNRGFLFFRYRPMLLEIVRLAVEVLFIVMIYWHAVFMALPFIIMWCFYDILVLFHNIRLSWMSRYDLPEESAPYAEGILVMYSIFIGFPFGSATKVLFLLAQYHWILLPYYILAVLGFLSITIQTFWGLVHCYAWDASKRLEMLGRIARIALHVAAWVATFILINGCDISTPIQYYEQNTTTSELGLNLPGLSMFLEAQGCIAEHYPHLVVATPVFIEMAIFVPFLFYRLCMAGMVWRFLPELMSSWLWPIAMVTYTYYLDTQYPALLVTTYSLVGCSAGITLLCNVLLGIQISMVKPMDPDELELTRRTLILLNHLQEAVQAASLEEAESAGPARSEVDAAREKHEAQVIDTNNTLGRKFIKGTLMRSLKTQRRQSCLVVSSCSICQEEYDEESKISLVKACGHSFHFDCIWEWMKEKTICPLCRAPISLQDDSMQTVTYGFLKNAVAYAPRQLSVIETNDQENRF